jgi:hypothetical protein
MLRQVADALEGPAALQFRRDVKRFIYGFVHGQFQDDLGPTEVVDRVVISDDFLDLYTHNAEGVILLAFKINEVNLDTESGDEEIHVTVGAEQRILSDTGWEPINFGHTFDEIRNREGTSWRILGEYKLADCNNLEGEFVTSILVREEDAVGPNDRYSTALTLVRPSCSDMQNMFNAGTLGIAEQVRHDGLLLVNDDGDVDGALSFTHKFTVARR